MFYTLLPKETAPYDDRSFLSVNVTAPEGATYQYTDRFMQELTTLVNDSIPEKKVNLVITGFGGANTGRMRMTLVPPDERERSQADIATALTREMRK